MTMGNGIDIIDMNWDGSTPEVHVYYEPPAQPPSLCTALIAAARAKGQWLYELTNHVYFSPDALERLQAEGRFRWSPQNFTPFDPERLKTDRYFENFSGFAK